MSDQITNTTTASAAAPKDLISGIIAEIEAMMSEFIEDESIDTSMTGKERLRLFGAGVRNFGFIEKSWDIARDNPQFVPSNFSLEKMEQSIHELEEARQLLWVLQQFAQAVSEFLLTKTDTSFRDALRVYGNLREQSRSKVPGARELYMALLTFFRRRRRTTEDGEETQAQLERNFMKLIHGKADGHIEIINEQPHFSEGVHTIVDDVHTNKASAQIKANKEVDE